MLSIASMTLNILSLYRADKFKPLAATRSNNGELFKAVLATIKGWIDCVKTARYWCNVIFSTISVEVRKKLDNRSRSIPRATVALK